MVDGEIKYRRMSHGVRSLYCPGHQVVVLPVGKGNRVRGKISAGSLIRQLRGTETLGQLGFVMGGVDRETPGL